MQNDAFSQINQRCYRLVVIDVQIEDRILIPHHENLIVIITQLNSVLLESIPHQTY